MGIYDSVRRLAGIDQTQVDDAVPWVIVHRHGRRQSDYVLYRQLAVERFRLNRAWYDDPRWLAVRI